MAFFRLFCYNEYIEIKRRWTVLIMLVGWALPVLAADTPNTLSISTWRDAYIFEQPPIAKINTSTYSKQYIEDLIRLKSEKQGINGDLAVKIAKAESGFNPNVKNPNSSASGLYQYLDSTFESYCIKKYEFANSLEEKNDPYIQIDCALAMIKDGGLHHWDASKIYWK